jgi:anti-sigma B factor antagonist
LCEALFCYKLFADVSNKEMNMTIDVEERAGVIVLHVKGDMGPVEGAGFFDTATEVLERSSAGIVVDLSQVPSIGSSGLGDLVKLVAQANTHEQRVILADLSPFVKGLLQTTKLDTFFEISPTLDEAIQRLG